jgi:N-acylneuraminate cytidylyltransferase
VGRGVEALLQGRFAPATRHFKEALAADDTQVRAHIGLGLARAKLGFQNGARAALSAALDLEPDETGTLAELVRSAFADREYASAEGYVAAYLARHPDADDFRFTLAGLQALAGRLRAARRTLAILAARRPDYPGIGVLRERVDAQGDAERDVGERFVLAVVPARGGSKGIPRKNLRELAGKPLLVHTVEAARAAALVDVVAVSTEDVEIARAARQSGAEVVDRPAELAGDESPTEPALLHAVLEIERRYGRKADAVLLLQATSPLRQASSIDAAVRMLVKSGCDSVVAVCEDRGAHFAGRIVNGHFVPPYDPTRRRRRQDLEPLYRETGAIYAVRREILFDLRCRMGGDVRPLVLGEEESVDIDTAADFAIAEAILERRNRRFQPV